MTQNSSNRISYPVRAMRISESVWEQLRKHKFMSKKTWNRLMEQMLDQAEQKDNESTNVDSQPKV